MRISKRSLLSVVALALTIAVTAFGTVAYMTDSDTVTNTFTVGNINITVDEENVDGIPDENGNPRYYYGGDFGEKEHDGNFCCDGLLTPDRKIKSNALEMKAVYGGKIKSEITDVAIPEIKGKA